MKTKFITKETKCPDCGETLQETIYSQINVTENPKLKEEIIRGTILYSKCPKCGGEQMNENDGFIYVDEEKKLEIIYGNAATKESVSKAIDDRDNKGITAIGCPYYNDLVTNIVAIDNNLDWRVTQMALLGVEHVFTKIKNEEDGSVTFPNLSVLTGDKEDNGELMVLIGYGEKDDMKMACLPLSKDVYQYCYDQYKEILDYLNPIKFDRKSRDEFCEYYDSILERYNQKKGGKKDA